MASSSRAACRVLLLLVLAGCVAAQKGTVKFERLKVSDEADTDVFFNLVSSDADLILTCSCSTPTASIDEYGGAATEYTASKGPFADGLDIGDVTEGDVVKCEDTDAETCNVCRLGPGGYISCTLVDTDTFSENDTLISEEECTITYEDFVNDGPEVSCTGVGDTGAGEDDSSRMVFSCDDCSGVQ